ncbi:MAG: BsuBI/PstI family type II restriction endonuclease [Ktedonobacterales bacterium]
MARAARTRHGTEMANTAQAPLFHVKQWDAGDTVAFGLLTQIDALRVEAAQTLTTEHKARLGQYFTPASAARLMADMVERQQDDAHILDAGAGVGSLFAALVERMCSQEIPPRSIRVTAYELDPALAPYVRQSLDLCAQHCERSGVPWDGRLIEQDFIAHAVEQLAPSLFSPSFSGATPITCAILNPPYRKIRLDSPERRLLHSAGIEETNLYTGFLTLALRLLAPDGELVAITPRSFCNGVYFKRFRRELLSTMTVQRLHLFESRQETFAADATLQETVILKASKHPVAATAQVTISASSGADDSHPLTQKVTYAQVVHPDDTSAVIHVAPDELSLRATTTLTSLPYALEDVGVNVSTGRVIDFRAKDALHWEWEQGAAPLLYPAHLDKGKVCWPKSRNGKKPVALQVTDTTAKLLIPNETYVLVRRFSSKEEQRRIVATVYPEGATPGPLVGFENHLNYFHSNGHGLPAALAHGLAAFLNSTLVDMYFRQFSGHTQVNAADLRALRFPSREALARLGKRVAIGRPQNQAQLDTLVREETGLVSDEPQRDPALAKQRIDEARDIVKQLGFPRAQQNERSALTLLGLLDLAPGASWAMATEPLRGVTPLMDFFTQHYGKTYAPNTRETVRRQTRHQFLDAALVRINPDNPGRPINSGQTVYQIEPNALALLKTYGTPVWDTELRRYLQMKPTLQERYAQERFMARIPLRLNSGETLTLSPGGQNVLIEKIIHEFAERFVPDGVLIAIGDAENKRIYFDGERLASLGVTLEAHGKAPDVIVYNEEQGWLALIEAVTSHGPINARRKSELEAIFNGCRVPLVFITAFLTRQAMGRYLGEIAWETEVWLADEPGHLIYFNGSERLEPYPREEKTDDERD